MTATIERVTGASAAATAVALAPVLIDTVASGASVGWVDPPTPEEAAVWWAALFADPDAETWVARDGERVLGTITLVRAAKRNGPHRGEVIKLMVHPDARGRGIAPALMTALEEHAAAHGLTLLVLDTETGSLAESLYTRWGWQTVGGIPGYAISPSGALGGTTIMYKQLDPRVREEPATALA
ncbi:GNAT family N-acetyltransferase [uncultured Leifsonia sp.]|uniref:GNAT family N-acetyltransferase n=1 Tax=uncultured Leifsonia sp. TaxID=340359 RepID=UPI0025F01B3E|nr:GNAT family N-acetyltransferase [uncultured Leifsonia sp.]